MKYIISIVVLIPFIGLTQPNFPKEVNDSLWGIWNDKTKPDTLRLQAMKEISGKGYVFTLPDSAFYYAQMLYDFAKKNNHVKFMADALNIQGVSHYYRSQYSKAIEYYKKSLKLREKINFKKGIADCYNNIGSIYTEQGEYAKSISCYLRSLKIKEQIGDSLGVATSYNNIGLVHMYQKEYKQAFSCFKKSLEFSVKMGNKKLEASVLVNMGVSFEESGEYQKAIQYYTKSLQIREEIEDIHGIAVSLNNLGNIYYDQKRLDKAEENYFKSLEIHQAMDDKKGMANTLINIGNVYLGKGLKDKALKCYLDSYKIAHEIGVLVELRDATQALTNLYKYLGDYARGLKMYEEYIQVRDSILSEENQKEVMRQQFKYDYEMQAAADSVKRLEEKKVREALIVKQKAELKIQRNQQYMLFGGLTIVAVFALFIFNRFKVTQNQKKIIEEQKFLVEVKNQEITDSINYARRIQHAILPPLKTIHEWLPDSFVFYKPKDIVAGDFYWMERKEDTLYIAACDCTGHGVPGAMVSVVCNNGLNASVREHGMRDTGAILDKTRDLVIEEFEKSEEEVKDGMDISLLALKPGKAQWSGANNPLWLLRDGAFIELKADKQPIGKYTNNQPFTTHELEIKNGDVLYLFTDGLQDQFGGEKGKKFKASKLKELLLSIQHLSMEKQQEYIERVFEQWMGSLEQNDDMCLIGIRI